MLEKYYTEEKAANFKVNFSNIDSINTQNSTFLKAQSALPVRYSVLVVAYNSGKKVFEKSEIGTSKIINGIIVFNFNINITVNDVKTVCEDVNLFVTIFNPEAIKIIKQIRFFGFNSNNLVRENYIDVEGFERMVNCTEITEEKRYKFIPKQLFNLRNLQKLRWSSDDLESFSAKFSGLYNLREFYLAIPYKLNSTDKQEIDTVNKLKSLTKLTLDVTHTKETTGDTNFLFEPNYSIKEYTLYYYGKFNEQVAPKKIGQNVANLKKLETFKICTYWNFDFTFPLINEEPNTTLKKIICDGNNTFHSNNVNYPNNIDKLTALESIDFGKSVKGKGVADDLMEKFYKLFYSRIYNETDSTKTGYNVSNESRTNGYFKTVQNLPIGFVHPKFRTHTLTTDLSSDKVTSAYKDKIEAIRKTGFTLITNTIP